MKVAAATLRLMSPTFHKASLLVASNYRRHQALNYEMRQVRAFCTQAEAEGMSPRRMLAGLQYYCQPQLAPQGQLTHAPRGNN
jgi:hypothetical protein